MQKATRIRAVILSCCVLICVGGIIAVVVLGMSPNEETGKARRVRWEFCSLTVQGDQATRGAGSQIVDLLREGWELVTVKNVSQSGNSTTTATAYYFKRRL